MKAQGSQLMTRIRRAPVFAKASPRQAEARPARELHFYRHPLSESHRDTRTANLAPRKAQPIPRHAHAIF